MPLADMDVSGRTARVVVFEWNPLPPLSREKLPSAASNVVFPFP